VSRFTLDSATEFLFGRDICSLSAGLPYPSSSPLADSVAFVNHPSNTFVKAFTAGQLLVALRSRYGPSWPLFEFWKSKVKPHRKVVDEFIEPILAEALAKQAGVVCDEYVNVEKAHPLSDTLLGHLVACTQGSSLWAKVLFWLKLLSNRSSNFEGRGNAV